MTMSRKEPFEKVCVICGKKFTSIYPQTITCSTECRRIHTNQIKHKYDDKRREKINSPVVRPSNIRICHTCGKEYEYNGKGSARTCPACLEIDRKSHANVREYMNKFVPAPKRLCHDCQKVYTYNYRCPDCLRKWREENGVRVNGYGLDDITTYSASSGWKHHGTSNN